MRYSLKYIYIVAILFVLVATSKYFALNVVPPALFFTLEFLSLLVVTILVYYVVKFIGHDRSDRAQSEDRANGVEEELKKRVEQLQLEVEGYQNKEESARRFSNQTAEFVNQFSSFFAERNSEEVAKEGLRFISKFFEVGAGIAYIKDKQTDKYNSVDSYSVDEEEYTILPITVGEGIHGQALSDGIAKEIQDIPDDYLQIGSGVGESTPKYIYILPLKSNDEITVLFELATFKMIGLDKMWGELDLN